MSFYDPSTHIIAATLVQKQSIFTCKSWELLVQDIHSRLASKFPQCHDEDEEIVTIMTALIKFVIIITVGALDDGFCS